MNVPTRVKVRRTLTDTPLARLHERTLARRRPSRREIVTFKRFDRKKYPPVALALAAEAQRALALGEYCAVDLFARLASGLALNAAPFDLVSAAACIPSDEIRHADLTFRMARTLSDVDVEVAVDRGAADRRWNRAIDLEQLDLLMAEVSAVGETLACALLIECRKRAVDPTARAVFSSIVSDEVHHARLGWYYLAWRAPQWTRAERQRLGDRTGAMVIDVERRFWRGRDAPEGAQAAARALGVLESEGQRRAVRAVMEDEIVPALDALGLGASHAWRARTRGR